MREWLNEYGPGFLVVICGLAIIALIALGISRGNEERAQYHDAKCAGLYSLAASRADSLEIAKDGCAAFLGRQK